MPNICYMMVGLPGSGKSTASEQLIAEMPELEVVSTDVFIEDYAKKHNITYNNAIKELEDKPKTWMNNKIQKLLKEHKNFIWDQTNIFMSARKKKLKMLLQNKYQVVAIVTELSSEELQKRLDNRVSLGGKKVSWKIISDMIDGYSRPEYFEGFSEIYLINDDGEPKLLPQKTNKHNI